MPLWEEALRSGLQLLKEDSGNALVEGDVTLISIGLANTLQELHRPQAALDVLAPAIARQRSTYDAKPENRAAGSYLALMEIVSADCQRELGNLQVASRSARASLTILESLVKTNPNTLEYQLARVNAFRSLGCILAEQGDAEGARSLFHEGLEAAAQMPQGPSMYDPASQIAEIRVAERRLPKK